MTQLLLGTFLLLASIVVRFAVRTNTILPGPLISTPVLSALPT
jgi:hypothetical protein